MQDFIYSVIPIVTIVVHLILNFNPGVAHGPITAHGTREYRRFLLGIFAYYIADMGWGVTAGLANLWPSLRPLLYIDTMLYYFTIALSVLTWCLFVIAYLELNKWSARILAWFGYTLLALYVVLLTANIFNRCLFYFDENGAYVAGLNRTLLFYPLVVLNIVMALFVLVKLLGSSGPARRRYTVVLLFCLTMAVAIVFQILEPLWPYYALGCLIGSCFFHVFVIEDERAELRRAVIEREQTEKHMAELKKALARARNAEKARSMFFSIVSHDIRTPLNAILGYSELLQYGVKSEEERNEALDSIRASGTTLLQLVNDVLDLSKMDSGKMTLRSEPVRLSQLTDEVFASFRMVAEGKGVELVNRTGEVPTIMLDEHRFRQILFNLVGNAVKFTDKGSVTVGASYSGTTLEVSVADTGCGIAPDMLTRILDPFFQVQDPSHSADRHGGTGLGLSICKSMVDVMGGELTVESELGKGATFRVRIPGVATDTDQNASNAAAETTAAVKQLPKHVLVIDDSPVNRAVMTAFLKRAGVVSIAHASDGEEALAELDAAIKAGEPFDFILSDLWMPNINGIEFIEKLRADARFAHLPCFAVTADTEFSRDARNGLFTGILLKPLTYAKLVKAFTVMDHA